MKKAVVLLSGGLDSATTLAIARAEGYELYAISFDYGQRHRIELEAASRVAASLGVKKHLVTQFNLRDIGGSALTADLEVPKNGLQAMPGSTDQIPVTYVPARNTIFLSFALAWAEVLDAADIFIGANAVDYSGYPDCRPEYLRAFETMSNLATKASVQGSISFRVHAPLLLLTKCDIIKKGMELGIDYALTWSCYDPAKTGGDEISGTTYAPCGRCDSCRFRKKGFQDAGSHDPLCCYH